MFPLYITCIFSHFFYFIFQTIYNKSFTRVIGKKKKIQINRPERVTEDGDGLEEHVRVVALGLGGGRAVEVPDGAVWGGGE